ncbi:MAG TPA: hypothetical protein DDZ55_01570 [Firmicutes bacterium]|nr:hypothetical protein [Bacillota bacterium]
MPKTEKTPRSEIKRVKIEASLLIPKTMNTTTLYAEFTKAFNKFPDKERIVIEKIKYDPVE